MARSQRGLRRPGALLGLALLVAVVGPLVGAALVGLAGGRVAEAIPPRAALAALPTGFPTGSFTGFPTGLPTLFPTPTPTACTQPPTLRGVAGRALAFPCPPETPPDPGTSVPPPPATSAADPTATATATATTTPAATPTVSATPTPTRRPTPTRTASPTPTRTPTRHATPRTQPTAQSSAPQPSASTAPAPTRHESRSAAAVVTPTSGPSGAASPGLATAAAGPVTTPVQDVSATAHVGAVPLSSRTVSLLTVALAAMVVVGGLARGRALSLRVAGTGSVLLPASAAAATGATLSGDRDDAGVANAAIALAGDGPGDRSWTWRFPGHSWLDAASARVPTVLGPHSPFLGRIADDAGPLRAMFGSLWALLPLAAGALGVLAAVDTDGRALPPSLGLLLALTAVSALDAFSGALASAVFAVVVLAWGPVSTGHDAVHPVLVVLALGFLWTSLPLVGSAMRPFRRRGIPRGRYLWERAGDVVIASLLCAWVAQKLAGAMDAFAGTATGVPAHKDLVAVVVLVCIAARILVEQAATSWYPIRLGRTDPADTPPPPTTLALATGIAVRTATYGFIGWAFIGGCWQWWLGTALFVVPQVAELVRERCATVPAVQRLLPRGLLEIFVLLVVGTVAVRYSVHGLGNDEALRLAYLVLSVPPAILSLVALVGGEEPSRRATVRRDLAGVAVLVVTTYLALHGWDY